MKVAVLFTGNIRTLLECQSNIKQNLDLLNPDYFVSTYNIQYQYHPCLQQSFNFFGERYLTNQEISDSFKEFDPKSILIDSVEDANSIFNIEYQKFHQSMKSCSSSHFLQYWKVKRGLDLIKEFQSVSGNKYDVVVRTRCDLMLKNFDRLDLTDISSKLIVGVGNEDEDFFRVLNDQLFISSFDNMYSMVDYMLSEFYNYSNTRSSFEFPTGLCESAIKGLGLDVISKPALVDCLYRVNGIKHYIH